MPPHFYWPLPQVILRMVMSYLCCCVDWLDAWHGFDCGSFSSLGERSWRHCHYRLDVSICRQRSVFQFASNYTHRQILQLLLQPPKCRVAMCNFIIKTLHIQHVRSLIAHNQGGIYQSISIKQRVIKFQMLYYNDAISIGILNSVQ